MLELTQTNISKSRGNCYGTSIFSIFELDPQYIPELPSDDESILQYHREKNPDCKAELKVNCGKEGCQDESCKRCSCYWNLENLLNDCWHDMWNKWFEANNLAVIRLDYDSLSRWEAQKFNTYHLLSGPSPRDKEMHAGLQPGKGRYHSVVGRKGIILWDPHPSRAGLAAITEIELIVPKDPSKPILGGYLAQRKASQAGE